MLSLSMESAQADADIQVVNGKGDGGIALGAELRQFAEALASRDETALTRNRDLLLAASSPEVVVDATAVAANFQRMVRIADSTGIPVDAVMDALSGSIQDELGLRRFHSAGNSPQRGRFHALKSQVLRFIVKHTLLKPGGTRGAE